MTVFLTVARVIRPPLDKQPRKPEMPVAQGGGFLGSWGCGWWASYGVGEASWHSFPDRRRPLIGERGNAKPMSNAILFPFRS
jgi:hypothetical protein